MVRQTAPGDQADDGGGGDLTVDLRGRLAVVIGASVGIGQAIAVGLASSGAEVVCVSRNAENLERTRHLIGGQHAHVETVDITVPESVTALVEKVSERYGPVTILVNSAGVMLARPALEMKPDEWDRVLDTQLRGPFLTSQGFGRSMADQGYGKIINMSSTWAFTVGTGRSSYSAAKAGLSHLTRALAAEWAHLGIRVNAIAPTATRTPAVEARLDESPGGEDSIVSQIPLGRLAEPRDVVGAALFLSSRASDFITGVTLLVDGGWTASKSSMQGARRGD